MKAHKIEIYTKLGTTYKVELEDENSSAGKINLKTYKGDSFETDDDNISETFDTADEGFKWAIEKINNWMTYQEDNIVGFDNKDNETLLTKEFISSFF